MLGSCSAMAPIRFERLPCKRKTEEVLVEVKMMEEKKLRVEQVVTALSNTDEKKKQGNEDVERQDKFLGKSLKQNARVELTLRHPSRRLHDISRTLSTR